MLAPFQVEAERTRAAIEDRSRAQRRINQWLIGFVSVTALLVVLVVWMTVKDSQRRAQSREILQKNSALSAQIADCTNVGGTCYEQSQQRLKATIQLLIDSNKQIAKCARHAGTDAELDACVAAATHANVPQK